jgi:hypothetical protein
MTKSNKNRSHHKTAQMFHYKAVENTKLYTLMYQIDYRYDRAL